MIVEDVLAFLRKFNQVETDTVLVIANADDAKQRSNTTTRPIATIRLTIKTSPFKNPKLVFFDLVKLP